MWCSRGSRKSWTLLHQYVGCEIIQRFHALSLYINNFQDKCIVTFIYHLWSQQATERERLQEELEEAKDKARRRSIGNIKFIGELFKLKMLTEAIMHDCVVKLLKNHDEESLECLCRLLTTIGKDLDFEKAKVS